VREDWCRWRSSWARGAWCREAGEVFYEEAVRARRVPWHMRGGSSYLWPRRIVSNLDGNETTMKDEMRMTKSFGVW
jgi:hypothetical protein